MQGNIRCKQNLQRMCVWICNGLSVAIATELPLHVFHLQRLSRCICNGVSVAIATEIPLQLQRKCRCKCETHRFTNRIEYPLSSSFPVTFIPHLTPTAKPEDLPFFSSSQPHQLFPFFPFFSYFSVRLPALSKTRRPSLSLSLSPSRFSKISHQLRAPPHRDPPLCTRNPAATPPWNNEGTVTISNFKFLLSFLG